MTQVKNQAASEFGRLGGKSGRGESKRRDPSHYKKIVAMAVAARKKNARARAKAADLY